jgi:predicted alpha/beta hydrolase family esterase
MTKPILFIHSAGPQGKHDGSGEFLAFLEETLAANYDLRSPLMPSPDDPKYESWKTKLDEELAHLDDGAILIGHSLGGSTILKYLAEEKPEKTFAAIFAVAAPFWKPDFEWSVDENTLHDYFASKPLSGLKIFLYRSRDDEEYPRDQLEKYAQLLPQATVREVNGKGHLITGGLPEIVEDIKNITPA